MHTHTDAYRKNENSKNVQSSPPPQRTTILHHNNHITQEIIQPHTCESKRVAPQQRSSHIDPDPEKKKHCTESHEQSSKECNEKLLNKIIIGSVNLNIFDNCTSFESARYNGRTNSRGKRGHETQSICFLITLFMAPKILKGMAHARVNMLIATPRGWKKANIRKRRRNNDFLLFSTKKRGRNTEKEGEEIKKSGQNIYPLSHAHLIDVACVLGGRHFVHKEPCREEDSNTHEYEGEVRIHSRVHR